MGPGHCPSCARARWCEMYLLKSRAYCNPSRPVHSPSIRLSSCGYCSGMTSCGHLQRSALMACIGVRVLRMVLATHRVRMHAVYEIPPLAAWASFDGGDILEFKLGHGEAPFEGLLDLVPFCSRVRDHPDKQKARLILDKLNITYLIPECVDVQVPERVAKERPSSSRVVDERLLRSADDGGGAGEVIVGATPNRIDGQVFGVISDELSTHPVIRRRYDAPAPLHLGGEQFRVTIRRVEVEAAALPAAVGQGRVLAVTVPVGDLDTEFLLEPYLITRREHLGGGDNTPDRQTAEQIFAHQVDERIKRTRIHVKEERW